MHFIRDLYNIKPEHRGSVLTIGNFDGLHRAHQALLARLAASAKENHAPSLLMTFEPYPLEYFSKKENRLARLTRLREKLLFLQTTSLDIFLCCHFNKKMENLSADEFIQTILIDQLAIQKIIVGDDFRFGHQRKGDVALLKKSSAFAVEILPNLLEAGKRISSSRIRLALADGDHITAEKLLGRPYNMMGRVMRGHQRGQQIGFPTANIALKRRVSPVKGVYAVTVRGIDNTVLTGIANVGNRPTVDGTRTLLEVHLFHFNKNIYGAHCIVEFHHKIRDEKKYDSLELLKKQIIQDVTHAKNYFEENKK